MDSKESILKYKCLKVIEILKRVYPVEEGDWVLTVYVDPVIRIKEGTYWGYLEMVVSGNDVWEFTAQASFEGETIFGGRDEGFS